MDIDEFIKKMPKAELHLHIEGTFEPELMFEIAARNGVKLDYPSVDELRAAYSFNNLQEFLDIYYQGASVLLCEQDFYDLAMAYFDKCAQENVTHAEVMFDPQTHTDRGVAFELVVEALDGARRDAESKYGMSIHFIMSYLRHLSQDSALETLERGLAHRDKFIAVGLDSSELGNPPQKFAEVYQKSIAEALIPTAHAGEEGPAQYIWEALDILHVKRVDHGNRCLDDAKLVARLVEEKMALTVCPLSNLCLQVVKDLKEHPLKQMLDLGLKATVNSDDPAYFGGYMNANFIVMREALDLDIDDIITLNRNAFEASFLDAKTKESKIADFDNFITANVG